MNTISTTSTPTKSPDGSPSLYSPAIRRLHEIQAERLADTNRHDAEMKQCRDRIASFDKTRPLLMATMSRIHSASDSHVQSEQQDSYNQESSSSPIVRVRQSETVSTPESAHDTPTITHPTPSPEVPPSSSLSSMLVPIPMESLPCVKIGHAQDDVAKTGVTVCLFPTGATVGVDISGGGPASRETPLLSPLANPPRIHAITLAGGSAFGLAASQGVMRFLEEQGIGYQTLVALVPLVCQSDIYDLAYGAATVRPTAGMGYQACRDAYNRTAPLQSGNVGAGIGATVGKICGIKQATKSGVGMFAVQLGKLKVGALVVLNAVGDVFDEHTGQKIAGVMNPERSQLLDTRELLYKHLAPSDGTNTTLGVIITNARFDKTKLTKIACLTRNAYARCIRPVGLTADGDTIYAASTVDEVDVDLNIVGTLAAQVMSEAIRRAVVCCPISNEEYLSNCNTQ